MGWGKFKDFLLENLLLSDFTFCQYLFSSSSWGKWFMIVTTMRNISGFQKDSYNNHS